MANLKVNTVSGIGTEGTVFDGGLKFRSKNYLTLPKGTTTERTATSSGISTEIGSIRYNTDSNKMECYVNDKWMIVSTSSPNLDGGGRGVAAGGNNPAAIDTIEYITIPTQGNSIDFGNLTATRQSQPGGTGSSTRGVIGGGQDGGSPTTLNIIEFITFATTGNALDFGDLTAARRQPAVTGSQTRGIFSGGGPSTVNTMDYVTIASTGNAVDFGDLSVARRIANAASSPTRSLIAAGYAAPASLNTIDYVTTSTLGNAADFGDTTQARYTAGVVSSSTRAVVMGGYLSSPGAAVNTIDYVTIATLGNALDFGDLTEVIYAAQHVSDSLRGVRMGGVTPNDTTMDYVQIASTGNAVDFGNLLGRHQEGGSCSNAHGGL